MEDGRKRPVIVKFAHIGRKSEILQKARNLKGKSVWNGVAITHDLTKLQCLEERKNELYLRLEKKEMLLSLIVGDRNGGFLVLGELDVSC